MATSLILHKRIKTTVAKAKALRGYVEPLITKSKEDTTHSRRVVFSYLQDKFAVTELFRNISGKVADRPGGYTRIIKLGKRQGDNAEMALIELVDYNELLLTDKAKKSKSTRRRRGGGKKKTETAAAATPVVEQTEEAPVAEEVVEDVVTEEPVEEVKEEPKADEKKVEAKKEEPKAKAKKEEKPEADEEKKKEE